MVPAAGDDLDAQAFVYDDDSDDGGSEVGDLEQCWTKHASPVPAGVPLFHTWTTCSEGSHWAIQSTSCSDASSLLAVCCVATNRAHA